MTPFEKFLQDLLKINFWDVVKMGILVAIACYAFFALVVIRQVRLMTKTVNGEIDGILKLIAWLHLAVTGGVFLLAMVIL